jgi:general secretion pathway protein D
MTRLRILMSLIVVVSVGLAAAADKGSSAYKAGVRAETENNYDAAYQAYKQAYNSKPGDPKYLAAYMRMRFYAAAEHIRKGQALRDDGKMQEAVAEFRLAMEIDSTNFSAQQEIRRTAEVMRRQAREEEAAASGKAQAASLAQQAEEAEGPIELEPKSDSPMTLRLSANADVVYKTIGKLAAVNVLIDSDYKPQKINIDLTDVSFRDALAMVALQSKTFWRVVSPNTILISADNPGKRKEVEPNVMKTFYLRNVASPGELQQAAATLKGILDINRVQITPEHRAITVRGTPDQMILAEKLLGDIDKPKAEVMIDVAVMQVSRDRLRTFGTNVPTSTSITAQSVSSSGGGGNGGSSGQFSLNSLSSLDASNFFITVPGASFSFLMTDGNTKVLQRPEIRALDDEKATLKIGDRVPIATGSFQPGGAGINPLVNTQFQYLDVGVNIDIIPHVHSNREVTLKMVLEISSVTGVQNIGGINQPTIGQRRIEHEARIEDGEVNLVGGILEDVETRSLSGYPWLTRIPILKYLFGQETKQHRENEIVFAITPHIVRANEVTEQNLRIVDVGTGTTTTVRRKETTKSAPAQPPNSSAKPGAEPQSPHPSGSPATQGKTR